MLFTGGRSLRIADVLLRKTGRWPPPYAQYRLQEDLRSFKIEVNKFFKRYMADHDGKEPEEDINSYSIRKKTIKTLLN